MISSSVILLTIAIILLVKWYFNRSYHKHLKKYPGPALIPLILGIIWINYTKNSLPLMVEWLKKYGRVHKVQIGAGPVSLMISDISFIKRLLGGHEILKKASSYRFLDRWLGNGLLTGAGERWKKHRKLLTPAFHFKVLEQFPEIFNQNTDILIEQLNSVIERDSIDIYPFITLCSLDMICETAMGTKVNAQIQSESDYVCSVREMCVIIRARSISPIKIHDFFYKMSFDYQSELKALKILHSFTDRVIQERKSKLNLDQNFDIETDEFGRKRKATLLDLLLQHQANGQDITDKQINEEVNTFLFEGHDTVSSALSFAIYSIAQHPHVQEKIIQELKEIFIDDFNRAATYTDLMSMKYLDAVIKETLRLYPSVPIFGRNVGDGIHFDNGYLPYDLNLFVCAYALHREVDSFSDPENFDPERFLGDNLTKISDYTYIPFSAGPRNCIGQKYAMIEMKAVISKVIRHFELLRAIPEHKLDPYADVVLKSKTGMCIRLKRRVMQ